ncbi:MAG: VanW family protein [Candidatus Peribacteraceae bacterium]|nr:VanW family protein [Candidatus Peribacteraceae bacterium]
MQHPPSHLKHLTQTFTVLLSILTILITLPRMPQNDGASIVPQHRAAPEMITGRVTPQAVENAVHVPDTMEYRVARRLKTRLQTTGSPSPDLETLVGGLTEREELMRQTIAAIVQTDTGERVSDWELSLERTPTWIAPSFSLTSAHFTVSSQRIQGYLQSNPLPGTVRPIDATVLSTQTDEDTILRAQTDTIAQGGYETDDVQVSRAIADAFATHMSSLVLTVRQRGGRISYLDENGRQLTLERLSVGQSNYKYSPADRIFNVRKALKEHVNNVIVPAGQVFSFNATLGGAVSLGNGWRNAKVIVSGTQLEMRPGGGICQTSTTVYRAIVNGGFPVIERRSHSLYVTYYKQYGVGIDATVYSGTQDLTFVNDTGAPLLIQASDNPETSDATVSFYGIPDNRTVQVEGPYFSRNAPDDLLVNNRHVAGNEIVWVQTVNRPDGTEEKNLIVSRYLNMPRSLAAEFQTPADTTKELMASRAL